MLDLDRPNNLVKFIYGHDKNVTEIANSDKNLRVRDQLGAKRILQAEQKTNKTPTNQPNDKKNTKKQTNKKNKNSPSAPSRFIFSFFLVFSYL